MFGYPVLATETGLDLTQLTVVATMVIGAIAGALRVAWNGGVMICRWVQPKAEKAFETHNNAVQAGAELAREMKEQVPLLTESITSLNRTQQEQCNSLKDLHEVTRGHDKKFETIIAHLSGNHEAKQ